MCTDSYTGLFCEERVVRISWVNIGLVIVIAGALFFFVPTTDDALTEEQKKQKYAQIKQAEIAALMTDVHVRRQSMAVHKRKQSMAPGRASVKGRVSVKQAT